ncbi:MAG: hypothetical protein DRO11_09675 [Methanobacteriota archaeon]|nr:MAG: hypothetical protein DRO11_09675 [Euryarchaeota archaeon]
MWGWYGRGWGGYWPGGGPWPGRGPFSYLPPWQRPGWIFGRGACWWLFNPWLTTAWWGPYSYFAAPYYRPPFPAYPYAWGYYPYYPYTWWW